MQATIRSCNLDTFVAKVVARDVFTLESNTPSYDLIFLDPPYDTIAENLQRIFEKAINPIALAKARALVELPGNLEPKVHNWKILRRIGKAGKDKPTALIYERSADLPRYQDAQYHGNLKSIRREYCPWGQYFFTE